MKKSELKKIIKETLNEDVMDGYKKVKLPISFPFTWDARDYHKFDDIKNLLQKLTKKKILSKEIEADNVFPYKAIFYVK